MPYSAKQVSDLQAVRDNPIYDGMTDSVFLAAVTALTESVERQTNTVEVFQAFRGQDLPLRSSDEWQNLMLLMSANAGGSFKMEGNILLVLQGIFGGTPSATQLAALATELVSPATVAGLPAPTLGDVERTV